MNRKDYTFWFDVGSQFLYGPETLAEVEKDARTMVESMNAAGKLPWPVAYKDTVKTADGIEKLIKEANYDDACAGIVTFCHTFSPSKMWINGLALLQKPWLHFHTQFYEEIPNDAIDMDYMNLHQSAHGDREHGFIGARMRLPRRIVVGHWQDTTVLAKIAKWMRAAVGVSVSKRMKVMRFGDKVEAQLQLGWQVNTWPVGALVDAMNTVADGEINSKMEEYKERYDFATDDVETVRYQAREELAMRKLLDSEGCMAFSNTFQDLYGMMQLPGLASQNMMADGYGYGGEGDWKVSAMTAIMKVMGQGMGGGTAFMEDYTYDLKNGLSLGAHMLEVCPSLAAERPRIEVHNLGIGDREPPARLVFEGKAGSAIVASLIDMGGRLRLIVQDIECVKPTQTMPNLPVARVMWKPLPDLATGAECWILAGGAHHTVLSYDCDAEMMRDWARMTDIEFVHISASTNPVRFEQELLLSDMAWKLRR